jgi:DNA adenine methylase
VCEYRLQPLVRYPGSKDKLLRAIVRHFDQHMAGPLFAKSAPSTYIEPFVGSGAVVARIIQSLPKRTRIVLSDKDWWLVCLWQSIMQEVDALCELLDAFEPNASSFAEWKAQDGAMIDPVQAAFRKAAVHYMSFSGLGVMAGGPIGGKDQTNAKYQVGCRWSASRLKRNYCRWNRALTTRQVEITCRDFRKIIANAPDDAFMYLDPPYYAKGPELYKHCMTDDDHADLAALLKNAAFDWVCSYDDHERIRDLYSWATVHEVHCTYTTATARNGSRPKNKEVVITP